MKQIFIVLSCCCLTTSLMAQYPLEDHMSWTESLSFWGHGSFYGGRTKGFEFFLLGDTVINNKQYKKLHANQLSSWSSGRAEVWEKYTTSYTDTVIYHGNFGVLRMDSTDRLYFLRTAALPTSHAYAPLINSFSLEEETLLHDFNIEVNDTLSWKENAQRVQVIDSFEVNSSVKVKRFWFNNYPLDPYYDYWLEGIGSIYGLFGAYSSNLYRLGLGGGFGKRTTLACFSSSRLQFPKKRNHPLLDSCYRNVSAYFDAANAPNILYNEERRREMEEKERQDSIDFQAQLDYLAINLYPNLITNDMASQGVYFELVSFKERDKNNAIKSISLFGQDGKLYTRLEGEDWAYFSLSDAFQLSRLSQGYYFFIFELNNGRRIVKKLVRI